MRTVHNDWLKDDIGGVAICGAGRSRPLAKEARAAGADWLCSGPGRPGKGRRRNLSRKSGCEAAAQRQWLSWSRRRRRRGLSTFESRMQVRVGLSLLLCAVLLGSAAATSGQYRASGSRPRATAPRLLWRQGHRAQWSRALLSLTVTRSCLGHRLAWAEEGA